MDLCTHRQSSAPCSWQLRERLLSVSDAGVELEIGLGLGCGQSRDGPGRSAQRLQQNLLQTISVHLFAQTTASKPRKEKSNKHAESDLTHVRLRPR